MADIVAELRGARLVDLNNGSSVALETSERQAIGLSVDDILICVSDDTVAESDIIVTLFQLVRKADGHWLMRNQDLPCLVNDDDIPGPILLSQGATIRVGDRYLRYSLRRRSSLPSDFLGPPAKPSRVSVTLPLIGEGIDLTEIEGQDQDVNDDPYSTMAIDDLANFTASYISHQIAVYTDRSLSSSDIDKLYRGVQSFAEDNSDVMRSYASRYKEDLRRVGYKERRVNQGPVVCILGELIKFSLEPVEDTMLWIELLQTLSCFRENLDFFQEFQISPLVLGAMAAYSMIASLQRSVCEILSNLATIEPKPKIKAPVKESAIELVVLAMYNHPSCMDIQIPALRTLAAMLHTYSAAINRALELDSLDVDLGSEADMLVETVAIWLGTLDFMGEHASSKVILLMKQHPDILPIQTEGRKYITFFQGNKLGVPRPFSIPEPECVYSTKPENKVNPDNRQESRAVPEPEPKPREFGDLDLIRPPRPKRKSKQKKDKIDQAESSMRISIAEEPDKLRSNEAENPTRDEISVDDILNDQPPLHLTDDVALPDIPEEEDDDIDALFEAYSEESTSTSQKTDRKNSIADFGKLLSLKKQKIRVKKFKKIASKMMHKKDPEKVDVTDANKGRLEDTSGISWV